MSYDRRGAEIGRDTLRTAGPETCLRLEAETRTCRPGEMVYLRVRYTDDRGEIKPMEKHTVSFTADNGAIVGAGSAASYFKGNFARSSTPTYFGAAQVIVRATGGGALRVTATDGERTATAELLCREAAD